jgi:hypothetical protein
MDVELGAPNDPVNKSSMLTRAIPRTAQSGAERITSAASEPKATKAAPRAAWRGGEPPGSESVQGSLFAGIDAVVSLEVGAFYWTVLAPDIVKSGREEQGSVSL